VHQTGQTIRYWHHAERIMQSIDSLGLFRLPDHDGDQLSGRLQFDPAGGGINLSLVVVKPIAKLTNRPANGPSQKAFDDPRQQFGSRRSAAMLYFDAAFNAHLGLNQAQAVALAKGPVLPKWCTG